MAYIALGIISSAIQLANINDFVRRAVDAAGGSAGALDPATERGLVIFGGAVGLVFVALECLFIWFAWKGRNWARIVLWVIGGLGIISGVTSLGSAGAYLPGFLQGLAICQFVLVLAGVVLFAQRSSNEWFRYRKWQRATGQG
jgi:hypothetical protein